MLKTSFDYFNYDNAEHRLSLIEKSRDRSKDLDIFDELHKLKNWKSWLKGIYDTEKIPPSIIVTGSAKLDTYKKVGREDTGGQGIKQGKDLSGRHPNPNGKELVIGNQSCLKI